MLRLLVSTENQQKLTRARLYINRPITIIKIKSKLYSK